MREAGPDGKGVRSAGSPGDCEVRNTGYLFLTPIQGQGVAKKKREGRKKIWNDQELGTRDTVVEGGKGDSPGRNVKQDRKEDPRPPNS